ncbi:MAG: CHAT domain-containing protein [Aureispira sp.]
MNRGYILFYVLPLLLSICLGVHSCIAQTLEQAQTNVQEAEQAIFNARNLKQALQQNAQAAHLFKAAKKEAGVRHTQLNAITAQLQQDQFPQAWNNLQALKALLLVEDARVKGLFLTNETWALWGLARYPEALVLADSTAQYWKEQNDAEQYSYALLLGAYAIYFDKQSNFSALEAHLERLENVLQEQVSPTRLVARHFYQLQSGVHRRQGHIDRAIEYSLEGLIYEQQALGESQQARDSNRVAKCYSQLGQLYADNGALEQSIGYYQKALEWYKGLQNYGELLKLCMRLGQLQHRLGNYAQAKFYFSSLKLYWPKLPKSPVWQQRNNTFQHLAKAYYYQYFGYHDSLLVYYDQQLPYLKKHQLAVDKAYQNIGKSAMALKQYKVANKAYLAALEYTTQKYGHKGSKPAQLYWILGQLAKTQDATTTAIRYFDQAAAALFEGQTKDKQRLIAPDFFSDKALAAKVYQVRGELYFEQEAYQKAQQDFDQVVTLAHFLRDHYTGTKSKFSSAQQLRPIYEKAAFCVWQQQEGAPTTAAIEAIFHYAESSKASLLYEHLIKFRNQYAHAGVGVPDSLLQKEERYLLQIARYQEQERAAKRNQNSVQARFYFDKAFVLEQQLQLLEKQLGQAYPHYKTWDHGRSQTSNLAKIQATLTPDQVLVEYFITDSHCFIIYVSAERALLKGIPKHQKGRFEKKVQHLRQLLSHIELAQQDSMAYYDFAQEAHWLYTHYLADPLLEGKKELLLLPDQDLHYIPFEVLLSKKIPKTSQNYGDLPYLLKKYALQYHYSASLFLYTQKQLNTQSGKVLGFAATYGAQNDYLTLSPALRKERSKEEVQMHNYSPPIPGTMDELLYLQQHFKGDFFSGDLANERQFKEHFSEQDYGIVHLAMHGTINYNQPAYSSLVFTENLDSLEDNLLYVYETQHLNGQQANLVVLSACKTGYGRYAEGEGIISLGRSFMHAGVPSVVMTLWELNDVTSIHIMSNFYALLATGVDKDEALRQAKLQYLEDNQGLTAHPFFWASPILIGNAVSIPLEQRQKPWMLWALLGSLGLGTFISWRIFGH